MARAIFPTKFGQINGRALFWLVFWPAIGDVQNGIEVIFWGPAGGMACRWEALIKLISPFFLLPFQNHQHSLTCGFGDGAASQKGSTVQCLILTVQKRF